MDLTVKINMDNADFVDDPGASAARILRKVARDLDRGDLDGDVLMDVNGNKVGKWFIIE